MKKIGFYGYPPEEVIQSYQEKGYGLIDLDVDFGAPELSLIPANACTIIKNIINHAFYYRDEIELILATVGEDKCDNGRFAAYLLKKWGFHVVETSNRNLKQKEIQICTSDLPLKTKVDLIMKSIVEKITLPEINRIEKPEFGFWGVPPNDFSILELFPNTTAVYGWVRCVEAGVPSDLELENFVDEGVKTVYFVQSFCSKGILAKELAERTDGLFIDLEKTATMSIKAKIEAFLKLR